MPSWSSGIRGALIASCIAVVWTTMAAGAKVDESAQQPTDAPTATTQPPSEAEQIISLRSLVASDKQWRKELREELQDTEAEYEQAVESFSELDRRVAETVAARKAGATDGVPDDAIAALEADRRSARDRFDAVIKRRRALQQQIQTLESKIAMEEAILSDLASGRPPTLARRDRSPEPTPEQEMQVQSGNPKPLLPTLPGLSSPLQEHISAESAGNPSDSSRILDPYVTDARERLEEAESDFADAQAAIELIDHALALFSDDLDSTRELQVAAQVEVETESAALKSVRERIATEEVENGPDTAVLAKLRAEQETARERLSQARARLFRHAERIEGSEAVIAAIREARARAIQTADEAEDALRSAERHLAFVKSPFAPHRLWRWLLEVGPKILFIVGIMMLARWLSGLIARRVVTSVVKNGKRGSQAAREERAETLSRVFRSTATVAVVVLGVLAVLNQSGIDVTVLLGGAAVFGAALAFGSQSLIKDYFSGFMVLAENQYSVGNVIRVGAVSGTVEDITLRMTVLRDLEGIVHFIPHSQVSTVSNMTYGWSRALFDIGVAYKEDVNQVMDVLMDLARDLNNDEVFGPMVLGDPEMLGVDSFGDSAVTIKFFVKTRPLKQWLVKRELLRRIKLRFDELGIEIPFPHRTVFHHAIHNRPDVNPAVRAAANPIK
jgi:small conductance mechanosensitive channel